MNDRNYYSAADPPGGSARLGRGFTIIELLIALVIMVLFLGIGYASFREFSQRQQIITAGRQLASDLREAQSLATVARKPAACGNTYRLDGYQFRVTSTSPVRYDVRVQCTNETNPTQVLYTQYKQGQLDANIRMQIIPSNRTEFLFKSLARGTDIASPGTITYWLYLGSDTNNRKEIIVTTGGEINY